MASSENVVAGGPSPAVVRAPSLSVAGGGGDDRVAETEAQLREAKTSLAMTLQEKDEVQQQASVLRKQLLTAMSQLTLLQQAMDSKLLRKGVARSMAISAKDKQKRLAADQLLVRNKAILMSLTHAVAGLPSPVDISRYDLSAESAAAITSGPVRGHQRGISLSAITSGISGLAGAMTAGAAANLTSLFSHGGPAQSGGVAGLASTAEDDEDDDDDAGDSSDERARRTRAALRLRPSAGKGCAASRFPQWPPQGAAGALAPEAAGEPRARR